MDDTNLDSIFGQSREIEIHSADEHDLTDLVQALATTWEASVKFPEEMGMESFDIINTAAVYVKSAYAIGITRGGLNGPGNIHDERVIPDAGGGEVPN